MKAMIRPERIVVEAHGAAGDNRLPGMVERAVFVGSAHELHVRLVGGDLLKATVRNDGSAFAYEEGTPVTLYLPSDAVRVLTPSSALARSDRPVAVSTGPRASAAAAAARPVRTAPSMYPATHWSEPQT